MTTTDSKTAPTSPGADDQTVRGRVWRVGIVIAEDFALTKVSDYLADETTLTWVDLCDPDHARLKQLADELGLQPLAVEDAIADAERAKATRYPSHTFVTIYAVEMAAHADRYDIDDNARSADGRPRSRLNVCLVSAFVLSHGLITVRAGHGFDIEDVVARRDDNPDLLAFTLDKTSGDFSPTTRYRDYAISRELIHWESQSMTGADSATGRRYRNHVFLGRSILLFARTRQDDRSFWFLGHGHLPKTRGGAAHGATWRLRTPLSGDLFTASAAAVA